MFGKNNNLSKSVSDTKKPHFKPNQGEILLNAGYTECYQNTCHCDFGKRQMLGNETMGGLAKKNVTGHMGRQAGSSLYSRKTSIKGTFRKNVVCVKSESSGFYILSHNNGLLKRCNSS